LATLVTYQSAPVQAALPPVKSWEEAQSRGDAAFFAAEYGSAERLLKMALVMARTYGPADMRVAKSAGELGHLLCVRGRFSEAEPYLEEELHVKEAAIGNDSGQLIPAMGSLVRFYLTSGTASKADPVTEDVLAFVSGKLAEAHEAATGKMIAKKGQPLQGWAGTAAPAMRDPVIEWAITCDDMGNLYLAHKKFELAELLFKAALDVKTTVLGKEHLSLANSYDSLGALCLAKNENEEAESYYRDALAMTEKILPATNSQVYNRLDRLAHCLIKQDKIKEAEELYSRANNDFWKDGPSRYGTDARCKFALGSLYVQEKNFTAAAPLLEQALKLSERCNGPDSIALVPYLQKYAYALYYVGRTSEVDGLRNRADAISSAQPQNNGM
jgi:tetratricopeptide (TPR) repeat protein